MALGGFVLGSLMLCLKGMRTTVFQLSGFYCKTPNSTPHQHRKPLGLRFYQETQTPSSFRAIWEFPKNRGTLFGGLYNKDPTI